MLLQQEEYELIGEWIYENGKMRADNTCERIALLTTKYLKKIAFNPLSGEWETLFLDPEDGRFWELTYPQGEMQGRGPPRLSVINNRHAQEKYQLKD